MGLEPGHVVGGRYRLVRPLATGGMGSIWVARHVELDVDVAVKFVTSDKGADERAQKRFRREARTAARLTSEHIVRVHDFGVDAETPYLVMELLRGEDLFEHLETHGRLPPARVATLLRQITRGLEVAHDAGVVHRDLKPSNLFIACTGKDGADEIVKILDFGVARERAVQPEADQTSSVGILLGSPPYMSPEQARAGAVDHRTDLWALGAIAFEMLTGQRLFAGGNLADTVAKICSDPIPRASSVEPGLGSRFDEFFRRALERDRDGRFQSASELCAAFETAAGLPSQTETPKAAAARGRDTETLSIRLEGATLEPVQGNAETASGRTRARLGWLAAGLGAAIVLATAVALRGLQPDEPEPGAITPTPTAESVARATSTAAAQGATQAAPAQKEDRASPPTPAPARPSATQSTRPAPRRDTSASARIIPGPPPLASARPKVDPVFGLPSPP